MQAFYSRAPFYRQYKDYIASLYDKCRTEDHLSRINYIFLKGLCDLIGIKTKLTFSSAYELCDGKNERLLTIIRQSGSDYYLSGPAAKDYIDESLRKAHEANEKLANIQKEGESILQEAREKQAAILKEAAETRDAIVEKAQDKAREEGARLLSDAKTQIENEKQNAIREIRGQVAELSVQIAEKVLKAKLSDDKAQMDMINRLLDEVSSDNKQ